MSGKPLAILTYPDPRLKERARPVVLADGQVDATLRGLIDDMLATIYATRSIGLAAPQVGQPLRLLVADVSEKHDEPVVLMNPEILSRELAGMSEEQCLSLPGISGVVPRSLRVQVRGLDREGQPCEFTAEGLLAVCIQHEIDHLEGTLFLDRLSWFKRLRARGIMRRRQAAGLNAPPASA